MDIDIREFGRDDYYNARAKEEGLTVHIGRGVMVDYIDVTPEKVIITTQKKCGIEAGFISSNAIWIVSREREEE